MSKALFSLIFIISLGCSVSKPYKKKDFIRVSRKYGYSFNILAGSSKYDGILITLPMNSSVYSSFAGIVSDTSFIGKKGRSISINSKKGILTTYYHLEKQMVNVGDTIKRGQKIATSGNSGACVGPCLGIMIKKYDSTIDPNTLLKLYPINNKHQE